MQRVVRCLAEISSIEPVGAIKSSLLDLTEVIAAFVPPGRERRRCLNDLDRDRNFSGCGHCRPDSGLSGTGDPVTIAVSGPCRCGVAHLITVAQHASGKELENSLKIHAERGVAFSRLSPESPET